MTNAIKSEFRKILTTRTAWVLGAALVVMVGLAVSEPLLNAPRSAFTEPITEAAPLIPSTALVIIVFTLLVGLRSFTDEFRYGSIVSTLLASPERAQVLISKVAACSALGLVYALGASLVALGGAAAYFAVNDIHVEISLGGLAMWAVRFGIFGMLWAAIGVGVGLAVKHQLPAIAGALLWVLAGEAFLGSLLPEVSGFLTTSAGISILVGRPDGFGSIEGAAILAGWTAAALVVGAATMRRRDIT